MSQEWQRLDPRMLLVGPVQTLRQLFFPALIALIGVSSSRGGFEWWIALPSIGIPILIGFLPYFTTRFRITESQFQIRRGLLARRLVTAPLDRVRSVDLEANLIHRVLGLTKVKVGTGVDETRIELNALSVQQAETLRGVLLSRRTPTAVGAAAAMPDAHPGPVAPAPAQVLAVIDWSWLKFAPFSLSKLAIVAGAIGALAQWGDSLPFFDSQHLGAAWQWLRGFAIPLVVLSILLGAAVGWIAVSVLGYLVQWWDLRLTRESGHLHLAAGAFTTRSTTVEEVRVRGVELIEPVLLRLVHGAELSTLATGVGSGGVTRVLPPCPVETCRDVGGAILATPEPLRAPLVPHGPAARRRCHVRTQRFTLLVLVVTLASALSPAAPWWIPVVATVVAGGCGVLVAGWSYAHLGHRVTADHLVAGSGELARRRTALERDGVIGWVIRQSFFQRRRGLATLVATTAAGSERVSIRDVPLGRALAVAAEVTPEAVAPFRA